MVMPAIEKVFWINKSLIGVMMEEDWVVGGRPPLFLNTGKGYPLSTEMAPREEYGRLTGYYKEEGTWVFMCGLERYREIGREDRVYVVGEFNGWGKGVGESLWEMKYEEDRNGGGFRLRVPEGMLKMEGKKGGVRFKFVTREGVWLDIDEGSPNMVYDESGNKNLVLEGKKTGRNYFWLIPQFLFDPGNVQRLVYGEGKEKEERVVDDGALLLRYGSQKEMGAIVQGGVTVFRVFAPRAQGVRVGYYRRGGEKERREVEMMRGEDGVWEVEVGEELEWYRYYYRVIGENVDGSMHFDGEVEVVDPYAWLVEGPDGAGIVVDRRKVGYFKNRGHFKMRRWEDLVIMEVHVRDLLRNAEEELTEEERRGFKGLRKWVREKGNYLKEMGVNAVELMPIQEYESRHEEEYHWGYMPVNYFAPASSYMCGVGEEERMGMMKEVVEGLHEAGLGVILDVVYNHVGSPNGLLYLDKRYYFQLNREWGLTNWSGCGNDLRVNTPMGRRLVVDSLKHWVEYYGVDGFRFDLAELMGVEVLEHVERELKGVKPEVVLIAEPWSFRGHIAYSLRKTGIAFWNDGYRDFMTKYLMGGGNWEGFSYYLRGSVDYLARFTSQSVNYLASHDDYCWVDKITVKEGRDGYYPGYEDIRRTHMGIALLMSSQGIPMIAQGMDMMHSKRGSGNSYNRGDLNGLEYNRRVEYSLTHEYFKGWVRIRLSEMGRFFRLRERAGEGFYRFYFSEGSSAGGVLYNANGGGGEGRVFFVINPDRRKVRIRLEGLDLRGMVQVANHDMVEEGGLREGMRYRCGEGWVEVPGLGCALFKG